MSEKSLNTNLASEFYVLSMLYRCGLNAHLTFGNRKSADIIIERGNKIVTIDVKGLRGKTNFPIKRDGLKSSSHFYIFISFLNQIEETTVLPAVYVVPSLKLTKHYKALGNKNLITDFANKAMSGVELKNLKKLDHLFLNRWDYLK